MIAYKSIGHNGRLGNQLFQIASTIGIAIENGHDFCFNNSEIFNFIPNLKKFCTDNFDNFRHSYNEDDFCYKKIQIEKDKNVILSGYFQSAKYFENNKQIVLDLMHIKNNLFDSYKQEFTNLKTCSLHIRRGDYIYANLNNPLNPHPLATLEYYNNAIDIINADKYIVFSDDIDWCKQAFKGDKFYFFDSGEKYKNNMNYDLFELQVMSSFKNNIIANSSFSWWAAYLNNNKDKTVIAPKIWFGEEYCKTISKNKIMDSLIPFEWILI